MPVLIDGYNLLRSIQKIDSFESLDEAALCRILSEFLGRSRDRGQIIFDGIGPPDKTELGGIRKIEVFFSGEHRDADTIIIEKIQSNTAPRSLIVVSSDRQLRDAAKHRKATSLTSDEFWFSVCKILEQRPPTPEPREKRKGLTEAETDQWLDAFGFDQ